MSREIEYLCGQVAQGRVSRREFFKRAMALGVAAPFLDGIFASAANAASVPKKGALLTAGMSGGASIDSLDPATFASFVPNVFGKCWGELLFDVLPNGELDYRLCESVESSKNAVTWSLKIRKGVEFHNGKTVTPQDVVETLARHSDPKSKSAAAGVLREIEELAVDRDYVVVTLKDANLDFPYLLTDRCLIIQPHGGRDNPAAGIGTGPYRVVINEPGVRYGGEKFANYWQGDELGHAHQIQIIVINDMTARTAALQSGQVNIINRVEPRVAKLLGRLPGIKVHAVKGNGLSVFNMFCDTEPFNDNNLRMALKLATNREQMVQQVLHGYGSVGNDFPINSVYPLFPEDIAQREFDPDQAKYLYQKSGHSGPIVLRTSDAAFAGAVDAAQLFQQSCAQAGIPIEVQRVPADGYWTEVWNKQPFCTSNWTGRATQYQIYTTAYTSGATWNDTHFSNEKFDKLIVASRAERDSSKRKQIFHEAALILRDQGGLILPFFNDWIDASGHDVEGWVDNPVAEMGNRYALARCWLSGWN